MAELTLKSSCRCEVIDITQQIDALLPPSLAVGICHVFCPHTTAGLTTNENADPAVKQDLLATLERLVPYQAEFLQHAGGNSDAHVKAAIIGSSLALPVRNGHLDLGRWQGVYFCDFDGPRTRWLRVFWQSAQE
jgi:secondary thiamine-phosphate synthase enzyme